MRRFSLALSFLITTSIAVNPSANAADFRFRLQGEPLSLDWNRAYTNYETYVLMNIMEGLVEIDKSLQPKPALALKWDTSSDGLTYTFHLRPDVKWSDGVPLKPQDFLYSWKRLLTPGINSAYADYLFDIENAEDFYRGKVKKFKDVGITILDGNRIQVKLRRVVPYFVSLLSFWATFPRREDLGNNPKLITLGPYQVTQWDHGSQITFERNPRYYGPQPAVQHIEAIIEPNDAKARALLVEKKIDALLEVSTEDVTRYAAEKKEAFALRQFPYLATVYMGFNFKSFPTDNPLVRKAIALAIDQTAIPRALQGGETPAESLVPKGLIGYDPHAGLPDDIEQAKTALAAARSKNGKIMPTLELLSTKGKFEDAANFIAGSLKSKLGLNIAVRAVPIAEYKKLQKAGKFHLSIAKWGADYPDPATFMEIMRSSTGSNFTRWSNAAYDELVKKAAGNINVIDRLKAYDEAQRLLLRDHIVLVPLYYPKITALVSSAVDEIEISPLNYFFFKSIRMKGSPAR